MSLVDIIRNSKFLKGVIIVGGISAIIGGSTLFIKYIHDRIEQAKKWQEWELYTSRREDVSFLEDELLKKPESEAILDNLMVHYSWFEPNLPKLREYTLKMIKYHPGSRLIYDRIRSSFCVSTYFREEVINTLKAQAPKISAKEDKAALFRNLARIYVGKALPNFPNEDIVIEQHLEKAINKWFENFGLDPNTTTFEKIDYGAAEKAVHYYSKALDLVKGNNWDNLYYSREMGELLIKLGREQEAIQVYEDLIKSASKDKNWRVWRELGDLYRSQENLDTAKKYYNKTIKKGEPILKSKGGSSEDVFFSYTGLGLIELEQGNITEAEISLRESSKHIPHSIERDDNPFILVEKFIEVGKYDTALRYLTIFRHHWKHVIHWSGFGPVPIDEDYNWKRLNELICKAKEARKQ